LAESRGRCQTQLARLPTSLRELDRSDTPYPVTYSERLELEAQRLAQTVDGNRDCAR
jgi:hypothetical protein